jgi:hypothetical protein
LPQERGVGGVFQQTPDQVGHTRQQLPVGAVHPHPLSLLHQGLGQGIGHAIEHLQFKSRLGHLQGLGDGDGFGLRAHIVAGDGGVEMGVVLQQKLGHALEIGVGSRLAVVNRLRPVLLRRQDGLLIPVGPLDQAHRHRGSPLFGPGDQVLQIGVAIPQVGLQRQANVGAASELRLQQQLLQNGQGEGFVAVLLHVEMDPDSQSFCPAQQDANPFPHFGFGPQGIDGIELGIEGCQLHRHLRHRLRLWPGFDHLCQMLHHLQIAIQVGLGFRFGDDGFPQQIQGESHTLPVQSFQSFADLL